MWRETTYSLKKQPVKCLTEKAKLSSHTQTLPKKNSLKLARFFNLNHLISQLSLESDHIFDALLMLTVLIHFSVTTEVYLTAYFEIVNDHHLLLSCLTD